MKSIRYKILLFILCSVAISCIIVGTAGVIMTSRVVRENASNNMNLLCKVNADKLENAFSAVENSVGMLAHYAEEELPGAGFIKDEAFRKEYTSGIERNALHHVEETEGVIAVYVRYDYDLIGENDGFFYVIDEETGKFEKEEITDLSAYDPDDIERVGWWHIPVNEGKPTWVNSYHNKNVDLYMFSYVCPFYKDGTLIGVVGFDISADYVSDMVNDITLYETGKAAVIENNGTVIYHPNIEKGEKITDYYPEIAGAIEELSHAAQTNDLVSYSIDGVEKELAGCNLSNGMILICFAPDSEIYYETNLLITQIITMIVVMTVLFSAFSISLGRKITRPIKKLNEAAKHFIEGETDFMISEDMTDEIAELAKTLDEARNVLKFRMDQLETVAHRDGLTGAGNKFAFLEKEAQINEMIETGTARFAVAVFDVNDLKIANDSFGHMAGDDLLSRFSEHLIEYYGEDEVFRLGGDEFVATAVGEKALDFVEMTEECSKTMRGISVANYPEIKVGCAYGTAVYEKANDYIFSDVLRRADREMYKNKHAGRK